MEAELKDSPPMTKSRICSLKRVAELAMKGSAGECLLEAICEIERLQNKQKRLRFLLEAIAVQPSRQNGDVGPGWQHLTERASRIAEQALRLVDDDE